MSIQATITEKIVNQTKDQMLRERWRFESKGGWMQIGGTYGTTRLARTEAEVAARVSTILADQGLPASAVEVAAAMPSLTLALTNVQTDPAILAHGGPLR